MPQPFPHQPGAAPQIETAREPFDAELFHDPANQFCQSARHDIVELLQQRFFEMAGILVEQRFDIRRLRLRLYFTDPMGRQMHLRAQRTCPIVLRRPLSGGNRTAQGIGLEMIIACHHPARRPARRVAERLLHQIRGG